MSETLRDDIVWDGGHERVTLNGGYPPVAWTAKRDAFGNLHYEQVTEAFAISGVFGRCIRDLTTRRDKTSESTQPEPRGD